MNGWFRLPLLITANIMLAVSLYGGEVISLGNNRFRTAEQSLQTTLTPNAKVIINSALDLYGNLHIISDSSDRVTFVYKKILKAPNLSTAMDYVDLINITMNSIPGGLQILLQAPNPSPWAGQNFGAVEGELHLPGNCQIELALPYFGLSIDGPFRTVNSKPSFGRLEAKGITEKLNLATTNQDIIVWDIGGDIAVSTANADIRIYNMLCPLTAATIRNGNGNIYLSNVKGAVDIENSYGKIKLDRISLGGGKSRIIGSYGSLKLQLADLERADLFMSNTNGDIEINIPDTVSAKFLLNVSSDGEIAAEGFKITPAQMDHNYLEFLSGTGESQMTVEIKGDGNIFLKGIQCQKK
ncbi:MAG: DUF4097 family beta strand repeat-containing protein [candidate division Zixibacteria bacterium]|nr:DUF4097 family beta strand repeat-containing protein [candidate division Zixibacteria bacterium]